MKCSKAHLITSLPTFHPLFAQLQIGRPSIHSSRHQSWKMPAIKDCYDRKEDKYTCSPCQVWFCNESSLRTHVSTSASHQFCVRCDMFFASVEALHQHYENSIAHWMCQRPWVKEECKFDGIDFASLCDHWKQKKCFEFCKNCNDPAQGWLDQNQLLAHRFKNHAIFCSTCGVRFLHPKSLNRVRRLPSAQARWD